MKELFDQEQEAILLLNRQGEVLFANSAASQILAISATTSAISVFSLVEADVHDQLRYFFGGNTSSAVLHVKGVAQPSTRLPVPVRMWLVQTALHGGDVFMMMAEEISTPPREEDLVGFLRTIANQTQDIVSVYDAEFNCRYVNLRAHQQLGYWLVDYYQGSGFLQFVDAAYREELIRNIEKDTQKGEISSKYRYITRKRDGELVEITNYVTRVFSHGHLSWLVANERVAMVDTDVQRSSQTSTTFILANADYSVRYVSPNADWVLKSRPGDSPPSLLTLVHPDDHAKLSGFGSRGSGLLSTTTPLRLYHSYRSYQTITTTVDRFFSNEGELIYTVVRWSEPDNSAQYETESREHSQPAPQRVVSQDAIILFYQSDLSIQYASPSVERILGYTQHELVGREMAEIVPDDEVPALKTRLREAISQSVPNLVCRIKKKDETYCSCTVAFRTIEEEGQPKGLFTIMHLMNSTNSTPFQLMLDHLTDALFLLRADDLTIVAANPAAGALFRQEHSQLEGASFLSRWMPKVAERLHSFLSQDADFATKDIHFTTVEGHTFWGNTVVKSVQEREDKEIIVRISDITERKKRELDLKRAQDAAQETMRAHETFLSQMSHEIRTPLNAVLGMTHLMLQSDPREDQMKLLQTLKFSGDSLNALINDILDFSKIEAGQLRMENKEFGLMEFIQGIKLTYKNLANDRGVMFRLLLEDEVPNFVLGDVNRLGQVLNNLLNNAVKFTEEGQIVLSVYVEKETDDQHILLFEVADTGIGIPKDKLSIVFEPYQQAGPSKYGGTGLGLSIVKNLVELQGGKISVRSSEGEGTTFKISLPFGRSQQSGTLKESTVQSLIAEFQSLEGLKVLYVEDVIPNQLLMEGLSDKWNVKLDTALNGLEALQKVKKQQYDLILMDIQMPKMDGYEAAMEIRNLQDPHYANIPIIALTASVSEKTRHRIREMGMNDYIAKPIDPKNLHQKLAELAKRRSSADSASPKSDSAEMVATSLSKPNFSQLNELYMDDDEGYVEILEQIRRLALECFPVIINAIRRMDDETLRFNCHKIMSYVRLLHLSTLEVLLNQAKEYVSGHSSLSSDRLIQQLTRHFDNVEKYIANEITTHT